ncbi:MAG: YraN family protein [Candidatus Firestonebacteria bacterium]|nr:YraN family protein [Candidatus Firestonebacteria bacterium]
MSFYRIAFGKKGEDDAVIFLKKKGYKILDRNYRTRHGEIDIIASEKDTLVFVEVKTRNNNRCGEAQEAMNIRKQEQIAKVAVHYIWKNKLSSKDCRFDVVAINSNNENDKTENRIQLIKNAFIVNKFISV